MKLAIYALSSYRFALSSKQRDASHLHKSSSLKHLWLHQMFFFYFYRLNRFKTKRQPGKTLCFSHLHPSMYCLCLCDGGEKKKLFCYNVCNGMKEQDEGAGIWVVAHTSLYYFFCHFSTEFPRPEENDVHLVHRPECLLEQIFTQWIHEIFRQHLCFILSK